MPETTTTKNNPIVLCDLQPTRPATHTFLWEWGQHGHCCAEQVPLLQQRADQLKRRISFAPLAAAAAAPLTRDERTQLIAARLSAEEEIVEVKSRGVELYNQNIELTRQVQSMRVRGEEREAQLRDAQGRALELEEKQITLEAAHGELVQEVQRLRALVPKAKTEKHVVGGTEKEK